MRQFINLQERKLRIQVLKLITAIFFFAVMYSCATGSIIVTGDKRAAINPTEVTIYIDPPAQYETIGIVEASCGEGFSRQSSQDKVINELKSQAAKIGANGVILSNTGSQSNGTKSGGTQMIAQGRAIYVIQK